MCEIRSCGHDKEALCICKPLKERERDIVGLLTHVYTNMEDVRWELDYTDLSQPEMRRLCLVGTCRLCGGRLCQELSASDELVGDDFLKDIYRCLDQVSNTGDCHIPRQAFQERFIRMFHERDRDMVRAWLVRLEDQMYPQSVKDGVPQKEGTELTVYTIIRTGADADRGSFPAPMTEGSFLSPLRARAELQKLICAEKEGLDGRYDCEDQDENRWEMYQGGYAAGLFSRLEILTSKLYLASDELGSERMQGDAGHNRERKPDEENENV